MTHVKRYIVLLSLLVFFPITALEASHHQYGGQFDDSIPSKPIRFIVESLNLDGQVFTLEGVVSAVCKSDGCWFNLKDDAGEVMVDLNPYNFRLPNDILGKKVKLNGRVNTKGGKLKVDAISVLVLG